MKKTKIINLGFLFILITLTVPIAYLVNIGNFGLYGDDLVDSYAFQLGYDATRNFLSSDKPLTAWLWYGLFKIFGFNYLFWNIYVVLIRIIIAFVGYNVIAFFTNNIIHKYYFALLLLLFPGFSQMPLSQLYGMNFTVLFFNLISIYYLLLFIKESKLIHLILSLIFSVLSYTTLDYFIGMELSKAVFIFLFSKNIRIIGISEKLKIYLPYIIVSAIYIFWRAFIFKPTRQIADQKKIIIDFLNNPVSEILERCQFIISDFLEAFIIAWNQTLNINIFDTDSKSNVLSILVLILVFLLSYLTFNRLVDSKKNTDEIGPTDSRRNDFIIYGLLIFIISMLPMWFAGRHINLIGKLEIGNVETMDRYILPALLGICLTTTGIFIFFISNVRRSIIVFSVLLALATSFHFRNGFIYKYYWYDLNTFLTQFTNRVPYLTPNTTIFLFGNNQIYPKHSYTVGVPINHLYTEKIDTRLQYWVYNLSSKSNKLEYLNLGKTELADTCRTLNYKGDSNHKIFLWYNTGSCLRVIDSSNIDMIPDLNPMIKNFIHTTNNDLCIMDKISPLNHKNIYRLSEEKNWAYFFEKAELEIQLGNTKKVLKIADEILKYKLKPFNGIETAIFIKVLIEEKDLVKAKIFYNLGMNDLNNLFHTQIVLNQILTQDSNFVELPFILNK